MKSPARKQDQYNTTDRRLLALGISLSMQYTTIIGKNKKQHVTFVSAISKRGRGPLLLFRCAVVLKIHKHSPGCRRKRVRSPGVLFLISMSVRERCFQMWMDEEGPGEKT